MSMTDDYDGDDGDHDDGDGVDGEFESDANDDGGVGAGVVLLMDGDDDVCDTGPDGQINLSQYGDCGDGVLANCDYDCESSSCQDLRK